MVKDCYVRTVGDDVAEKGISFLDSYDPRVKDCYIRGSWDYGVWAQTIKTSGSSYEGGVVENSTLVGPYTCVYFDHTPEPALYEPGLHILGCHMNPKNYAIHLRYHRQGNIQGNYFYMSSESEITVDRPASIFLDIASDVNVCGNQYLESGFYNSDTNCSTGVIIGESSNGIFVHGEIFNSGGIGIVNQSTEDGRCVIGMNTYSLGQRTGSFAPFTPVLDETKTLTRFDTRSVKGAFVLTDPTATNSTNGIRMERFRDDYATESAAALSGYSVYGLNSTGEEIIASENKTAWEDNTDGSESAVLTWFLRRNGTTSTAMELVGTTGILNVPNGFRTGGFDGVTGSFTTNDGKTITIRNGIVTAIV